MCRHRARAIPARRGGGAPVGERRETGRGARAALALCLQLRLQLRSRRHTARDALLKRGLPARAEVLRGRGKRRQLGVGKRLPPLRRAPLPELELGAELAFAYGAQLERLCVSSPGGGLTGSGTFGLESFPERLQPIDPRSVQQGNGLRLPAALERLELATQLRIAGGGFELQRPRQTRQHLAPSPRHLAHAGADLVELRAAIEGENISASCRCLHRYGQADLQPRGGHLHLPLESSQLAQHGCRHLPERPVPVGVGLTRPLPELGHTRFELFRFGASRPRSLRRGDGLSPLAGPLEEARLSELFVELTELCPERGHGSLRLA